MLSVFFSVTFCSTFEDETSPAPSQMRHQLAAVQMTPGQFTSAEQAQIHPEMFYSVFGKETVTSWQLNWDVLQDQTRDFDHPQKRALLKSLDDKLTKFSGNRTMDFLVLYGKIAMNRRQIELVHKERLELLTHQYFSKLPHVTEVTLHEKEDGVQLGFQAIVTIAGKQYTYHVKTHAEGKLASKSTAAKVVNTAELLVYKLLEFLKVGPEAHFFQRSPEDTYIATLNAGVDSQNHVQYEFLTFDTWKKRADLLPKLMGCFAPLKFLDLQGAEQTIESQVQTDAVAQSFMRNVMRLDLLSRVLRLGDTTTNPSNFGFANCERGVSDLRLIDFRVPNKTERLTVTDDNFGGFLEGNGEFNYNGEHPGVKYALHNRAPHLRMYSALAIMNEDLARFLDHMGAAHRFVTRYIRENREFQDKADELIVELDRYKDAIADNFQFFKRKLEQTVDTVQ